MIQITHVEKKPGANHSSHITRVRWYNPADGKMDTTAVAAMVEFLDGDPPKKPKGRAYVCDGNHIAEVETVHPKKPNDFAPYLRTVKDGVQTDNLLSLPPLPT